MALLEERSFLLNFMVRMGTNVLGNLTLTIIVKSILMGQLETRLQLVEKTNKDLNSPVKFQNSELFFFLTG